MFQIWSDKQTHPGRKRTNNEDYVTSWEPTDEKDLLRSGRLYIVADGVGGASKGEKASKFAAEKVLFEYYRMPDLPPEERLRSLMRQAGNEIYTFAEDNTTFMRMASTMVAAVVIGNRLTLANVGDSRAYLIRGGQATQLTKDHSWVAEMVRNGVMTEEEARKDKRKNRITRSLGGETDVRVDISHYELQVGDKVLLCTDGFSQYATEAQISQLVADGEPDEITQRLIKYAYKSGGSDNISVILLEVFPETFVVPDSARRGDLEAPDSLEDMATTPGFEEKARVNWKLLLRNPLFVGGGAVVLVLIIVLSCVIIFGLNKPPALNSGSTLTHAIEGEGNSVLQTLGGGVFAPTQTEVAVMEETKTPTPLPTGTNTVLPTQTITPTPSPTDANTNTFDSSYGPNDLITCQYRIRAEDQKHLNFQTGLVNLHHVVYNELKNETLGSSDAFGSFAFDIRCSDVDDNACTYKPGGYDAVVGWVLDIPDIQRGVCESEDINGTALE